jgi:hypothetical protein
MEYARKIESGRKKAANKLNAKIKEIKATKGKTPLAKNKAEREKRAQPTFSERARAKRMDRGQPFNMKTPQNVRNAIQGGKNMKFVGGSKGFKTVTPKTPTPKVNTKKINNYVNGLSNNERNVLKKKICQP